MNSGTTASGNIATCTNPLYHPNKNLFSKSHFTTSSNSNTRYKIKRNYLFRGSFTKRTHLFNKSSYINNKVSSNIFDGNDSDALNNENSNIKIIEPSNNIKTTEDTQISNNGANIKDIYQASPSVIVEQPNIIYNELNGAKSLNNDQNGSSIDLIEDTQTLKEENEYIEKMSDPCIAGQLDTCATTADPDINISTNINTITYTKEKKLNSNSRAIGVEDRWSKRKTYNSLQRTLEIWKFAVQLFFKLSALNKKSPNTKEEETKKYLTKKKEQIAVWLRESLIRLGPTFIKIGQQFSTRVDVLSQEFIKELEKLQDNVPPFEADIAISIIEKNFEDKIENVFDSFDKKPIAAASLGQVHIAKIKGNTVVVKVQRPGLKELFDIDLKNVRVLAQLLQKLDPKSDGAARDWVAIYDECSRILYEEIDYGQEGENAERFRKNFEDISWVKVPKVYWNYTTAEVLVMEYCPGTKINNAKKLDELGIDRKKIARFAVESYLQQILRHGFFHADPHPGNVSVDCENGGRLIYYDFGMMGSIPGDVKLGLVELFYAVYKKDINKCIDALVQMRVLVPGGDITAIKRTGNFFLTSFQERLIEQRKQREVNKDYDKSFKKPLTKEEKKAKRKKILSNIGEDLLVTAADQPFRFPAEFTFVVRAFSVLDGIGKSLDAKFDISEIAAPYARDFVLEGQPQLTKLKEEIQRRAELQQRALANLFRGPNLIEDINTTLTKLENGDLKLRVRALEAERALNRVEIWQKIMSNGIVSSTLFNIATMLKLNALQIASVATYVAAIIFAFFSISSYLKLKALEKKEKSLTGIA